MKKMVFATNNANKLREIREIINGKYDILSLSDINCKDDIPETSDTIEGNALLKAKWVKDKYGYDCFADDTALEVEVLDNRPGVYSARYAGEECNSEKNIDKLLFEMQDCNNRNAQFRTVIALIKGEDFEYFEGKIKGTITEKSRGESGFGYDPIFICTEEGCAGKTFGEATAEEKDAVSHRGKSLRIFAEKLENYLKDKEG